MAIPAAGGVRPFLWPVTYLTCLTLMTGVGLFYPWLSPGLGTGSEGQYLCRDLMSSGGDDDAMLLVFGLFAMPLGVRLVRLRQRVSLVEIGLHGAMSLLAVVALWLGSLDCAEIFATAFGRPDLALTASLVSLPLSNIALMRLRITAYGSKSGSMPE